MTSYDRRRTSGWVASRHCFLAHRAEPAVQQSQVSLQQQEQDILLAQMLQNEMFLREFAEVRSVQVHECSLTRTAQNPAMFEATPQGDRRPAQPDLVPEQQTPSGPGACMPGVSSLRQSGAMARLGELTQTVVGAPQRAVSQSSGGTSAEPSKSLIHVRVALPTLLPTPYRRATSPSQSRRRARSHSARSSTSLAMVRAVNVS
jgi:hypothetical protein